MIDWIQHACGLVLVGRNAPVHDYLFGTVTTYYPSDRDSRARGSLSVLDFLKLHTRAKCSSTALYKMRQSSKDTHSIQQGLQFFPIMQYRLDSLRPDWLVEPVCMHHLMHHVKQKPVLHQT